MWVWQFNPYAIPLFVGSIPVISFVLVAWRHRSNRAARFFLAFAMGVAGFMLTYALELLSATLPLMLFWLRLEYIFSLSIPVFWLMFVLAYTGRDSWLIPRRIALLFAVPTLHLFAVWTNDYHGLNWATVGTQTIGTVTLFARTHGLMFYIGTAYLYGVILAATIVMALFVARSPGLYRGQIASLILGVIFFWLGSALTITGLTIVPELDLTPFGAALACVPIAWSLFHYRLLDIVPAAHSAIVNNMADAVIVIDSHNRLIALNPAAENLLDARAARFIGQPVECIFADNLDLVERYRDVQEAQGEMVFGAEGDQRFYDLRISPFHNRRGETTGRIVVLRDVTRSRQAEAMIRRYAAELEERNNELDAFGHTIAHDLKAPLATIQGYADIMLEFDSENLNPQVHQYIQNIRRSSVKMMEMVNELLQLANVREIGSVVTPVEMTSVANAAADRFQDEIKNRGIQMNIMPAMPPALGHALWLEEVFANLISNAIKYIGKDNPAPCITIRGRKEADGVIYEVQDNGLGIAPQDQEQLFKMFARFHQGEASGLGLGLSICLRIVKRLNGRVGVESRPGEGSTFWFTLPAPAEAAD
jgi:PAS domain S-box-containing protein